MTKKRYQYPRLSSRLLPGVDDDLITWLRALESQTLPHGEKSQRIKAIFRRGLQESTPDPSSSAAEVEVDLDNLLPEIRRVVESAVRAALEGLSVAAPTPSPAADEEEDDGFLSALDANLFLEDAEV